jgi:hypothetical protein
VKDLETLKLWHLETLILVGLGRVELPTSPLSGVRSSHLSYRPGLECSRNLKSFSDVILSRFWRRIPNPGNVLEVGILRLRNASPSAERYSAQDDKRKNYFEDKVERALQLSRS